LSYRRTIVVAFLLLIAGCEKSGAQIAPVHGRVTLDGQPLAGADIQFQPVDSQRSSTGRTGAEGQYQLMYKRGQPGAIVGQHRVRIWVSHEVVPNPPVIAKQFDAESTLTREVKPGDNEYDFDVTKEKNAAKK
jgi:hypothetical protein